MATVRQAALAREIIANLKRPPQHRKNKGELVESVGYTKAQAEKKPTEIIESKGVKNELISLGFNPDTAMEVVKEILIDPRNEPSDRLAAAREVFKVHGTYAAEKSVSMNVSASAEEVTKAIQETMRKFRQ